MANKKNYRSTKCRYTLKDFHYLVRICMSVYQVLALSFTNVCFYRIQTQKRFIDFKPYMYIHLTISYPQKIQWGKIVFRLFLYHFRLGQFISGTWQPRELQQGRLGLIFQFVFLLIGGGFNAQYTLSGKAFSLFIDVISKEIDNKKNWREVIIKDCT